MLVLSNGVFRSLAPKAGNVCPPLQNCETEIAQELGPRINPRVLGPSGPQKCQSSVIAASCEASLKVIHASIGYRGDILETPAEGLLEESQVSA